MVIRNADRRRRVIQEEIEEYISNGGDPASLFKATVDSIEGYKKELDNIHAMKIVQTMWHHIADLELMSEIIRTQYLESEV